MKNESYNLKNACPGYPLNRNGCEKEKSAQDIYCRACCGGKARRLTFNIKNMKKYTDVISGED